MAARKLLLLGATGSTGRELVSRALQLGHEVTVLVRRPEGLGPFAERLRVHLGSFPRAGAALTDAVRGQDAVISALGVGTALKSSGLIGQSAPEIVAAMEREGVRRLIFTSAYGVGATRRDVPVLPRILMRLLFRDLYTDKASGEEAIQRSRLEWTIVYPVTLTNGPRSGRYRVGERLALRGFPTVSRADVAEFILTQIDDPAHVRQGVLIAS